MSSANDKIMDLEIQVAHQSHTIEELSDEVARQGRVIDSLERRVAMLMEKSRDMDARLGDVPDADQRPPHY